MKKAVLLIMSSLFLLVGTFVLFWMLSIIGFLKITERKKERIQKGWRVNEEG